MQRLSEIATPNQVRQSLQEFADMNAGAVQVKEALGKNSDRDDAAAQDWPHQQSAFLDVIDHAGFVALFLDCGKATTLCTLCGRLLGAGLLIACFSRAVLARETRER